MNRFLEWFYEGETSKLVKRINEYAEKHNLQIISITTNEHMSGARAEELYRRKDL